MVHEKSRLRGFQKTYVGRVFSGYLKYPLSWGFLRVLGAWMTFKKADMAKTLTTRFSMIETNPLNHKWLDFVILTGLVLHQFQTKWLLSAIAGIYRLVRSPIQCGLQTALNSAIPRFSAVFFQKTSQKIYFFQKISKKKKNLTSFLIFKQKINI